MHSLQALFLQDPRKFAFLDRKNLCPTPFGIIFAFVGIAVSPTVPMLVMANFPREIGPPPAEALILPRQTNDLLNVALERNGSSRPIETSDSR